MSSLPILHAYLTDEEFRLGWKMMKERTSAGISGLTFIHMKVCELYLLLISAERSMVSILYNTKFSPLQWRKAIDTIILKSIKSTHVDKLRTILILESDYNFNSTKLGRDVDEPEMKQV